MIVSALLQEFLQFRTEKKKKKKGRYSYHAIAFRLPAARK